MALDAQINNKSLAFTTVDITTQRKEFYKDSVGQSESWSQTLDKILPDCRHRSMTQISFHNADHQRGTTWCLSCMCSWRFQGAHTSNCRYFWPQRWFDMFHRIPHPHYNKVYQNTTTVVDYFCQFLYECKFSAFSLQKMHFMKLFLFFLWILTFMFLLCEFSFVVFYKVHIIDINLAFISLVYIFFSFQCRCSFSFCYILPQLTLWLDELNYAKLKQVWKRCFGN